VDQTQLSFKIRPLVDTAHSKGFIYLFITPAYIPSRPYGWLH